MILIKNGTVYSPDLLGKKDILVAGGKILAIEDEIRLPRKTPGLKQLNAKGMFVTPGFIDSHVHICGGGGEGGFKTRTPEVAFKDILSGGITTVVGTLGTDGTTRSMENLLAKAYGLDEEGINTYIYTGSYSYPVLSLSGSVKRDIILIPKIIGCGEIALSDHRGSQIDWQELADIASEARVGGILSGKAGVVNVHLGDGKAGLQAILDCVEKTDIPISQFSPTHINRNPQLFAEGIEYAKKGGYVDFTTSTTPEFLASGEISAAKAVKLMLEAGVDKGLITLTTDAQGSLPAFDEQGRFVGLQVGRPASMLESVQEAVFQEAVTIEEALATVTRNPADILKLHHKGRLEADCDADLVIFQPGDLSIKSLIAKGELLVHNRKRLVKGTFEEI